MEAAREGRLHLFHYPSNCSAWVEVLICLGRNTCSMMPFSFTFRRSGTLPPIFIRLSFVVNEFFRTFAYRNAKITDFSQS